MNLNTEIGKKKDVYPSKKSINLYYYEEVSTKISTIALNVTFVVVVLFALIKIFLVDVIVEKNEAELKVEEIQKTLDYRLESLKDYDEVAEEYAHYSYKVLVDDMKITDRMDILAMIENTVFVNGRISNVSIVGYTIALSFEGLNLDECAQLINNLKAYEMVETVVITDQSGSANGTYEGNIMITLVGQETGGVQ